MQVLAASTLVLDATDNPVPLREQVRDVVGKPLRRINRFTELALIGAHNACRKLDAPLPADTGLYLACALPNVSDTVNMIGKIIDRAQPPAPLEFINVSSNMAGFHVAATLGLDSINLTVARRHAPLEAALELVQMDLASAPAGACALLGFVQECCWPLDQHRQRMALPADAPLAEFSHWLVLSNQSAGNVPTLTLHRPAAALDALIAVTPPAESARIFLGSGVNDTDHALLEAGIDVALPGLPDSFDYSGGTATGELLSHMLSGGDGVYFNQDADSKYYRIDLNRTDSKEASNV